MTKPFKFRGTFVGPDGAPLPTTPGPWEVFYNDEEGRHILGAGHFGAIVCQQINSDEDANLIAAAPDLLAALERFVGLCPTPEGLGGHAPMPAFTVAAEYARAAIAKAKAQP